MKMEQEPVLSVEDLSVSLSHQQKSVIASISFALYPGEIYALVGESGSGKSVTSLAMMRLLPHALQVSSGAVRFQGQDLFAMTEQQMTQVRGDKIAMIFQEALTSLNPVQTIGQQIEETLRLHTHLHRSERRDKVLTLLKEVRLPEPDKRIDWYPHQLSGGQQQRVMIAMALACEPDVLIADEPTTALDVTIQKQVLSLIKNLAQKRQLAVLLITHDMGVVQETAQRVGVMLHGKIVEESDCATLFTNPQHEYTRRLIASLPDQHVFMGQVEAQPLLIVDDLKVHFAERKGIFQRISHWTKAVDGVSLTVRRGETLALVGESGCGKTTMGRAILNLEKTTAGTIQFAGTFTTHMSRKQMLPLRKRIQVIFQDPYSSMNPRMTVRQILEEGMISLRPELTAQQREERVLLLLEQVQLQPEHLHRYPHEFSGGQRQRIAIARTLAVEPELIICDEPTSALDVSTRAEILKLLQELQSSLGVSYLFITHDLSIIPQLAHRVAVMKAGKIVEAGRAETILSRPNHPYTRELLEAMPQAITL